MEQKFLNKDFFYTDLPYHAGFYIEHREKNMHSHEFYEISYVYEGQGTHYHSTGNFAPIKEGNLFSLLREFPTV